MGSCSDAQLPLHRAANNILGSAAALSSSVTKPAGEGRALLLSEGKSTGTKSPAKEPGAICARPPRWDLFCASLKSTKRSAGKGWWTPRVVLGCRKWGRAAQTHTGVVLRQLVPETVVLLRLALSIGLPQPLYHLKMSPRLSRSISAVILAFYPIRRCRPSAGTQHRNAPHAGARSPILPLELSSSPHPSHPPHPNWFFESFFHAAPSPRGGASRSRSWALPPSPESPRPIPAARSTAAPTAPASRPQPLQHVQGGGQRLPEQKRPRQRFSSQTQQVSAVLFVCRPSTTREGGGGGRWRALGCCPVSTARRGSPRFAGRWWPWLWCPHFWWALSSGCGVSQGVQCLNVH